MTRVFTAALATEINTYSPRPVDLESFREHLLAHPGEHPDRPTVVTGPIVAARRHARAAGWTRSTSLARPEDEANYQGAGYGWQWFFADLERVAAGLDDDAA